MKVLFEWCKLKRTVIYFSFIGKITVLVMIWYLVQLEVLLDAHDRLLSATEEDLSMCVE